MMMAVGTPADTSVVSILNPVHHHMIGWTARTTELEDIRPMVISSTSFVIFVSLSLFVYTHTITNIYIVVNTNINYLHLLFKTTNYINIST